MYHGGGDKTGDNVPGERIYLGKAYRGRECNWGKRTGREIITGEDVRSGENITGENLPGDENITGEDVPRGGNITGENRTWA